MKNKAKAIEVIKNDCKVKFRYITKDKDGDTGDTCAIGALALAAGADLKPLLEAPTANVSDAYLFKNALQPVIQALNDFFGLEPQEMRIIQSINDSYETQAERQEAILEYLDSLPEDPQ